MSRTRVTLALGASLAVGSLLVGGLPTTQAAPLPSKHLQRLLQGADSGDFPGAEVPIGDEDFRGPRLSHLNSAVNAVARLGSGIQVSSWTQYGTPLSVYRPKGYLATGMEGRPSDVARSYLRAHSAVWGLSPADVDQLQIIENAPLSGGTSAYSVSFNQKVDGILVSQDGYVVVGVVNGKVAGVTSSLVPTSLLGHLTTTKPKISMQAAVLAAAKDAGISTLKLKDLSLGKLNGDLREVKAVGLHQLQYARLRVLPTTNKGAKLVFETAIEDVANGRSLAAQTQVDALTGKVLLRRDGVKTAAQGSASVAGQSAVVTGASFATDPTPGSGIVTGSYSKACSKPVAIAVRVGDRSIVWAAASSNSSDDIVVNILRNGAVIASGDTLSQPEAATATLAAPGVTALEVAGKKITVQVCPFSAAAETGSTSFTGTYVVSDQATPGADLPTPVNDGTTTGPATWLAFSSNPQLAKDGVVSIDDRYQVCSGSPTMPNLLMKDLSKCNFVWGSVGKTDNTKGADGSANLGFPSPYAYDLLPAGSSIQSNTTSGNNAITTNAQLGSSLTAGAPVLPPVDPTRNYGTLPLQNFTDAWHTAKCDPTSLLTPQSADTNAAIINLFVGHNRIHDFSYRLGMTEPRGALQLSNFGKADGVANAMSGDPETGNAQNAALTNDAFTVTNMATGPAAGVGLTGRDNANQIALMDGVPGITNQYLFQPVVGFYAPCTDGDLDASVFLHEYTHAISNRLIAGPATGLSGQQGGSMGESWSDLDAIEYLNAFDLAGKRGEDKYALGAYVTGDPVVGIRDYNLFPTKNPLNYSDFGFDTTGAEVHADGEVWNAVQMTIRQALIAKYESQYHYADKKLQKACALGVYDNGAAGPTWNHCPGNRRYITYMYDALIGQANGAPSMVDMRDAEMIAIMMRDPADYDTVYNAFASRGLGLGAESKSSDDLNPVPSFASNKQANNAHVTFNLVDANTGKKVKASVFVGMYTARCRPIATTLGGKALDSKIDILKGTYTLTVQGKGYGLQRFTVTYKAGQKVTTTLKLAQNVASGAYASSVKGNTGALRLANVIDDSETTNGAFNGQPVAGRQVVIKFGGGKATFDKLALSSLHHPPATLPEGGTEIEGRLLGTRAFNVEASGDGGSTWKTIYKSPNDFFPANHPRATAPDLLVRYVNLPKPVTANALRVTIRSNTCTGGPDFNHEQENDPTNPSDCRSTATNTTQVTLAEVEVFRANSSKGAVVVTTGGGGKTTTTTPPSAAPSRLPTTGGSTGLALGGIGLLGMAGTFLVLRRRTVRG